MANPRKFSEKIALHNKKQAEETAAFEAVLREVSATTQGIHSRPNPQHLQQQQLLGEPSGDVGHGGSLPDVKFASNKSINLQDALLEMKQTELGRQNLFDKIHRCRQLREQNHMRQQYDQRRDCSPYSLSYLSLPPDTSWRRAHSDSAIHSSTLGAPSQQTFPLPVHQLPPTNGGMFGLVPGSTALQMLSTNDSAQVNRIQACCCDLPHGISNVHQSTQQDSGLHILPNGNDTGSLPDLSELHFTAGNTLEDLGCSIGCHQIGPMRSGASQGSPGSRHRRGRTGPKPLFLPSSPFVAHYQGNVSLPPSLMQYRSLSECGTPSPSPISPSLSLHSYSPPSPGFFSDVLYNQQQQQLQQQQQQHCMLQEFEQISMKSEAPQDSLRGANYYHVLPATQQPSFQSPVASTDFHFSMSDCPGTTRLDYLPHAQVLQTSNNVHNSAISYCRTDVPEANSHGCFAAYNLNKPATDADQMQFDISVSSCGATAVSQQVARIPDIILTGADDMLFGHQPLPDHNVRNASTTVCSSTNLADGQLMSTVDDLFLDDALGVGLNPLELDELQMLTDANVLTDPETEDAFRFDQL